VKCPTKKIIKETLKEEDSKEINEKNDNNKCDKTDNNPYKDFTGNAEDYKYLKEIGKGAYAVVKQAIHKPTKTKVAIKIYEKFRLMDVHRKEALKREINVLKKLNNPNIVKLIEVINLPKQVRLHNNNILEI